MSLQVQVVKGPREHPDTFLKRFIKKVKNSGHLRELDQKKFYMKPSEKRRRKQLNKKNMTKREKI